MGKTYAIAEIKFIDVGALSDSEVSSDTGMSFDNLALFKADDYQKPTEYASLEHNLFILDGGKVIADNPTDIAYMSASKSKSDCTFTDNPTLTIAFDDNHASYGLTFYFAEDYPAEMKITYYSLAGGKIISHTAEPDSLIFSTNQQVENYAKIVVEFTKTNWPEQQIKLQYILYGKYLKWSGDDIKTASVVEDIDITGSEISINTASIVIIDTNDDFDIGNDYGAWKSVQKYQPVKISEYKDGSTIDCGTFYIDDFSFASNVVTFSLMDGVGMLDYYTFYDGTIYENASAGDIIASIFKACSYVNYEVEEEIANMTLSGYLAVMTCREALQQVAFICGAVVDDSRADKVRIYKPTRTITETIDVERKFNGQTKVSQNEYVSGISIEFSKYSLSADTSEIYNDTLSAGTHKLTFDNPYDASTITASTGTIEEVSTNYIVIIMDSNATCLVEGVQYEETTFNLEKSVSKLEAGKIENIKSFTGVTLYNPTLAQDKLEALLKYYQLRKTVDLKYLLNTEGVGNWAIIKGQNDIDSATLIESQTIDLTGGFISTASCRGYTTITPVQAYTGDELYTNDGIGGYIL